ncbi:la-related protein 1C-like [Bidens hawaiensis]|uniref:la-related protein 1C-like n=1 Tax=Bidens hawaiensis TaxID=980011 RepID=UPI00404A40BD
MTADSSTASITPSAAAADDSGGGNSPSGRKTLPSAWVHVVRGGIEPGSIAPVNIISDPPAETAAATAEASDGNAGGVVKWVWSKPSVTSSPVMGAASWPALSESTRTGVKSVAGSSDGSSAASQAPVISQPPPKQAKPNSNPNHNSNLNHRQKSVKRGGAASGSYIRPPQPPPGPPLPPPFPLFDMYGNLVPAIPEPPPPPFKPSNWSPRHVDHSFNQHPGRRNNNFGPRPFNNGYGGRREHHGPSGPRSPAVSNVHVPPHQMVPPPPPPYRGYFRPPFLVPPPLRPYGAPIGYEMGASYVYFPTLAPAPYRGGAPVLSPGPSASSVSVTDTDASLHDEILKQIEYYFSDDNLVKDNFLRSHMDEDGWVPLTLIAGFPRMQAMTNDIQMLLNILKDSSTVEIQDEKVRRRVDWKKWVHTHTRREATENAVEEASLQMLTIEDGPANKDHVMANGDVSNEDH